MKKLVYGAFALAAIALSAIGCQKEVKKEQVQETNEQTVWFKLQLPTLEKSTRASSTTMPANAIADQEVKAEANNNFIELKNVTVLFLDNSNGIVFEKKYDATATDYNNLQTGVKIDGVPVSAKKVAVFGNLLDTEYSSDHKGKSFTNEFLTKTVNIQNYSNPKYVLLSSGKDPVNLNEITSPTASSHGITTSSLDPKAGEYYAQVTIKPLLARVEFSGLTWNSNSLKQFTLESIFANNFYKQMTLAGKPFGTMEYNGPGGDVYKLSSSSYPYTTSTNVMYNWYFPTINKQSNLETKTTYTDYSVLKVTPDNPKVWGFNVVPQQGMKKGSTDTFVNLQTGLDQKPITRDDVIHFVFRFTNLQLKDFTNGEVALVPEKLKETSKPAFLTVSSFYTDDDTKAAIGIEAGKVYTLSASDMTFTDADVTADGDGKNITVYVKVTVQEWNIVTVKPNFN